ncbi:MAG: YbaB/EbfC family nucleoid-associated protein [Aquificota bacterium]|uniref:Nucleoid-associated protein ENF32_05075 n=1 Tax=Thermosulfidibacter takaii TaxID=412593 RepID=A0A7C0U6R7_9BACT|nr:MAG: YbaB/EbfC family nucleoid-associated protein [Aquificota bacterium]HDD53422.1 YbaB/EbfC family nucleoid-associated protein [Thermosulfidibacter takaii]
MNLTSIMKQVQRLQARIAEMKEGLAEKEVEGTAGGGMVRVVVNGRQEVLSVVIEPEAMEDREMLEDLITAAVNDAMRKSKALMEEELSRITSELGVNIPGLF